MVPEIDEGVGGDSGQGMKEDGIDDGSRIIGDQAENESGAEGGKDLGLGVPGMVERRDDRLKRQGRDKADGGNQGEKQNPPVEEFPGYIIQEKIRGFEGDKAFGAPAGHLGKGIEAAKLGITGADKTGQDGEGSARDDDQKPPPPVPQRKSGPLQKKKRLRRQDKNNQNWDNQEKAEDGREIAQGGPEIIPVPEERAIMEKGEEQGKGHRQIDP
jgi:hypothetical protein